MINIKEWRQLQNDITTDSLWISSVSTNNRPLFIIPKRNWNIKNSENFHGLFIPEIPYQFITRFTKSKDDLIWDPFFGSGTTKNVADYLGYNNGVYSDLHPINNLCSQKDILDYKNDEDLNVQVAFCHPPYHNIVKYSDDERDGSNKASIELFLDWLEEVAKVYYKHIKVNGYVILVLGNLYLNGEEKTLGVWGKDRFCKDSKFICKAQIIKDYGETKGSDGKNYNLNYVRQLRSGYNNFYGDNIFILKKNLKRNK